MSLSLIERYEAMQHKEKLSTGIFISVKLSFWMHEGYSKNGTGPYEVGEIVRESELSKLPERLMKKIRRIYPHIYSGINDGSELRRIKTELDNAFSKPNQ